MPPASSVASAVVKPLSTASCQSPSGRPWVSARSSSALSTWSANSRAALASIIDSLI